MTWRVSEASRLALNGRFWRVIAPRWAFDPLSGAGAARVGGRWNQPGQPALYLSDSHGTAIAEYQQDLPRPGTLTAYDVNGSGFIDLTDPATMRTLGLQEDFLRQPWKRARDMERRRPPSWDFATVALADGCHGLLVSSVQAPGSNVVLWRWNQDGTPSVQYLDPLRELPVDEASWRR